MKNIYKKLFFSTTLLLFSFLFCNEASAISLGPTEFGLRYRADTSANYNWQLGLYAGPNYYVSGYGLNGVRVQWQNTVMGGNYASIHGEVNIVAWEATNVRRNQWVNLPYQSVYACASSAGNVKIEQSNISYAITNWTHHQDGSLRSTLTMYIDIALSGLNHNANGYIACLIGSDSYAFATVNNPQGVKYYVESAATNIEFSTNINDVLLQTQINQNQTIISQNEQIISGQQATNDWLTDNTAPSVDTSDLGDSVGWLPPGPVDSILTLPLTLLRGIVGVFTNTNCAPLSVPVPYTNTNFTLPCVTTLMDEIGFTSVWTLVGGVISAVIIWNTLKWLYDFVDKTLTLRENNSGLWGGL